MLTEHSAPEQSGLRDLCSRYGCSIFRATNGYKRGVTYLIFLKFQNVLKVEFSRFRLVTVSNVYQFQIWTDLDFQMQQ